MKKIEKINLLKFFGLFIGVFLVSSAFYMWKTNDLQSLFGVNFFVDQERMDLKKNSPVTLTSIGSISSEFNCDVLIVGGGTGGVFAAIQSSRDGAKTCLIEETDWLGGMMTAAGVSSLDGNSWNYTGLLAEFIDQVKEKYDFKVWQTQLCFAPFCYEPHVGLQVLRAMVSKEPNLTVFMKTKLKQVVRTGDKIQGVVAVTNGKETVYKAKVTIDATEFGDVMYLADIPFDLGADTNSNEPHAQQINACLQPITVTAVIRNTGVEQEPVPASSDYNPEDFYCTIPNSHCSDSTTEFQDWNFLEKYGQLPNGKIMINIPSHSYGNDFDVGKSVYDPMSRDQIINLAKKKTLNIIHFFQTELGKGKFEIVNEFNTKDALAVIPYVRESRRLKGVSRITENDMIMNPATGKSKFWDDSIAVGDYPLDIHNCEHGSKALFIKYPPFQIPYSALIPQNIDGFIAAEKNISVSHVANGRTRLQPIVASVGQAAGGAAAMAAQQNREPREIDIRELQKKLLASKTRINYYYDLRTDHWAFDTISMLAQAKIISGTHDGSFGLGKMITRAEMATLLVRAMNLHGTADNVMSAGYGYKDVPEDAWFADYIYALPSSFQLKISGDEKFKPSKVLTRGEAAKWIVEFYKLKDQNPQNLYFEDLPNDHPYKHYINTLVDLGVMSGDGVDIRPDEPFLRGEAAMMVYRLMPENNLQSRADDVTNSELLKM